VNDSRVQILLVSPDLLAISRLSGLAKEANVHVETLRSLDAVPEGKQFNLVLLDIGSLSGDPATLLCSARDLVAIRGGPPIVTFGPHVAKDRFADAIAAGAAAALSRGEVLGGLTEIVRRYATS
jgi:CheY-like chemotaxis protein